MAVGVMMDPGFFLGGDVFGMMSSCVLRERQWLGPVHSPSFTPAETFNRFAEFSLWKWTIHVIAERGGEAF